MLVYLLLFLTSPVMANNHANGELAQNIQLAHQLKLWQKTEWLNLIHYQPENSRGKYLSQVDDPRFFLAPDGKQNPENELIATLKALYSNRIDSPDDHAQCRFIARYHWLIQQFSNHLKQAPSVNCPSYNEWRKNVPEHKVTLIFPAYHLNSPSSMFGHTLLRIDPDNLEQNSSWLSMAVNFGANIEASDNSILFAIKGLAGGYHGNFIVTPYYKKIKEYNRQENRDIWEYPLNLTPQETRRIVLHLWELKGINFDYYFFDENCSYRLLELLEVARPSLELKQQFGLTAIPVDTVRAIEQANLIESIDYRPSQYTSINYLLRQLTPQQQALVHHLSQDASEIDRSLFRQQDKSTQMIMLDTAYRYLRFQQNDQGRSEGNARTSFQLLQEINKAADFNAPQPAYEAYQQPEKGHLSKRLSLAAGEQFEQSFVDIKFRMSFHSLEDNINGFLEGAQINLGSLSFRATEDEFQLQNLDVIDIFSLTPRNDFFQPLSWKVYTGLEQQLINGTERLTGHVTGGAGVTYETWQHGYFYALMTARLEANSQFKRSVEVAMGFSSGLLHHATWGTTHLSVSGESFANDEYRQRIEFITNIPVSRNHALGFKLRRQRQPGILFGEAQLNYHYFFH